MNYPAVWFILWSVLWAVYFTLDGFDFGAGMLLRFVSRNESDREQVLNSTGPVWNGNEVWLLTAGGATLAAFPIAYASMFSFLYTALLLILFALIFRGVSFELRSHKKESPSWRNSWDWAQLLGSFLPALLFGVAFGNIFQGLPFDASGYHGSLLGLLNPYGLLTGLLFVLLFIEQGALYLSIKTAADLAARSARVASTAWYVLLVVAAAFLIDTNFATSLYDRYVNQPLWILMPALAVAGLIGIKLFLLSRKYLLAFSSSCLAIMAVVFTGTIGLYPNLIPSNLDPAANLTIYNSASSTYTLRIMTVVAVLVVPVVIAYQLWLYWIFRPGAQKESRAG